ncbi:ABC transporter permease [Arthrobacter sp. FW306-04-A]|uniref:ABC transporter permease n=1 Tax=Arthrobacter sp. FW306-04-A TaxID=2879619 RepID=UPI0037C0F936|nr:ABC transporter permease subunit [Arthrobacter sp. FW306-04-A]
MRRKTTAPRPERPSPALGTVPYFAFMGIFLVLPVVANVLQAFKSGGSWSTDSLARVLEPQYVDAFVLTTNLSLVTALAGGALGLVLAWALAGAQHPLWLKNVLLSYSAMASQSGGVPLAFAFIATVGAQGLLTWLLPALLQGFRLDSFAGVALVYLYFQIPLMTVLMLPALSGLRREWHEAATTLGAKPGQYLKDIALPVLAPSLGGALLLLFANSFSAYATAYALAGGGLNLVPLLIGFFIAGNVMIDESFAAALATVMMFVIVIAMGARTLLDRRSRAWLDH